MSARPQGGVTPRLIVTPATIPALRFEGEHLLFLAGQGGFNEPYPLPCGRTRMGERPAKHRRVPEEIFAQEPVEIGRVVVRQDQHVVERAEAIGARLVAHSIDQPVEAVFRHLRDVERPDGVDLLCANHAFQMVQHGSGSYLSRPLALG